MDITRTWSTDHTHTTGTATWSDENGTGTLVLTGHICDTCGSHIPVDNPRAASRVDVHLDPATLTGPDTLAGVVHGVATHESVPAAKSLELLEMAYQEFVDLQAGSRVLGSEPWENYYGAVLQGLLERSAWLERKYMGTV